METHGDLVINRNGYDGDDDDDDDDDDDKHDDDDELT